MDLIDLLERLPDPVWRALLRFMRVTEEAILDLFNEGDDEEDVP